MITAPTKFQRKFKYTDMAVRAFGISAGVTNNVLKYNLNSLFQIDQLATGPESIPGLTEFSSLYNRARVMAAKVKVRFSPSNTGTVVNSDNIHVIFIGLAEGMSYPAGTGAQIWTAYEEYAANNPKHVAHSFLTPVNTSGKWRSLSKFYKMRDLFTTPDAFEAAEGTIMTSNSGGGFSANPARIVQGALVALSQTSGGATAQCYMVFQTQITFYVEFNQVRIQSS